MWLLCGLYTYLDVFEDFFFAIAMDHQKITGRRLFFFFVEYQRLTMLKYQI